MIWTPPSKSRCERSTSELTMELISKAQFTLQFNKWQFRKNLKDEEWEYIRHQSLKRKRDGKESKVLVDGRLISTKRIKKEMSRRFPPTFAQRCTSGNP